MVRVFRTAAVNDWIHAVNFIISDCWFGFFNSMNTPRRFLGNALHRFLCSPLRFLISTSAHLSKMVLHVTLAAYFSISQTLAQIVVRSTIFTLFHRFYSSCKIWFLSFVLDSVYWSFYFSINLFQLIAGCFCNFNYLINSHGVVVFWLHGFCFQWPVCLESVRHTELHKPRLTLAFAVCSGINQYFNFLQVRTGNAQE